MSIDIGIFNTPSFRCSMKSSTTLDAREVKKMLLSGDKNQILQAVERVKVFAEKEECLSDMISSDISEFLCDAMTPFDAVTCREIFCCLEYLVQHVEFFTQGHSCHVLESLIRSIHFFLKNIVTTVNLTDCLHLLVLITEGYNKYDVIPERESIENILQILPVLIKSSVMTIKTKHQIGCIMLNLTKLNSAVWINNDDMKVVDFISDWIDVINEVFHLDHPFKENLILLTSFHCHFVLKTVTTKLISTNEFHNESQKDDLILKIIHFLVDFEIPYLDALPVSAIESEPIKADTFFKILLCFYADDVLPHKIYLTHGLGEAGFLQFVTKIISFADFRNSEGLRKIGVCVLSHVILTLVEDVFQIADIWPESREHFRCEIQKGFSLVPLDASQWLDLLVDPESPNACKISLLFYLYFYCMTSKSKCNLATIYPSIATFINCTIDLGSYPLLVKVVWFVYVMSKLSSDQNQMSENENEETNKIVLMLQMQGDLDLVYTHHPAMLYWAFFTEINSSIQLKIVHLWLRNKTPNCKELENLIEKSSDIRFALLDILQNESGDVLDTAYSTLKSVLSEQGDGDLVPNLWFLLPQILAKYTTDSASAQNVDYIIELCSLKMPENFETGQMFRIASLLPEVFIKSDLISVLPSLTLAFRLLESATNDLTIMRVFLRIEAFLEKVIEGIRSSIPDIAVISLKILTLLWRNANTCYKSKKTIKVKVNKEDLFGTLFNTQAQVLVSALELLREIILTGFSSTAFEITDFDMDYMEILFFEIENICVKGIPDVSALCWSCLKCFLLLNKKFAELQLSSDPLLHEVINYHLTQLQNTPEMKDFLFVWLDLNAEILNDAYYGRKIFGEYFLETLENIFEQLKKDMREEDRPLYKKVLQCGDFAEEI